MSQRDPLEALDSRLDAVKRRIHERYGDKAEELKAAGEALAAGETNSLERVRRIAHKLRGHTRDAQLTKSAAIVEELARSGNVEGVLSVIPTLVEAAHAVAQRTRATPWPPALPVSGGPHRVLVVDDDASIRQVVSLTLARLGGYEVVAAGSVDEASALCRTRSFDLAIVDRCLPGTDGVTFARGVREHGGAARIVIYSGAGRDEEDGDTSRVDDWWQKPLSSQDLLIAVKAILSQPPRSSNLPEP